MKNIFKLSIMLNIIKILIKKYNTRKINNKKEKEWFNKCIKELI